MNADVVKAVTSVIEKKAFSAPTRAGGYIYLAARDCPTLKLPVKTADRAAALWCAYRDYYGIGGSDMKKGCGDIRTDAGETIARVSYNGRVWDGDKLIFESVSL